MFYLLNVINHDKKNRRESLYGLGATKERVSKGDVLAAARETTKGGMVVSYGHHVKYHSALDQMLDRGMIDEDQHAAGYIIRRLYYTFTSTGTPLEDFGQNSYPGDFENASDRARDLFNRAISALEPKHKNLVQNLCLFWDRAPDGLVKYGILGEIREGLDDLDGFFKKHLRS